MILVDTSIWIDHLRKGDPGLASLLRDGRVLAHTFVIGELAMGQVSQRQEILQLLADLPHAEVASADEVMALVESRQLFGVGIGYVDAHLLASTLLTSGARLWTRDKRLAATASTLGLTAGVPTG